MKIKELLKNSKLEVEKVEGLIEFVEKISESRDFDSLSKYLAEHIEPAMTSENYQKLSSSLIIGLMNLNEDKDDNKQKNGEEKMAKRNRRERAEVIEQRIKDKLKKDRKERRTNVDEQKREDGREARRARRARKARLEEHRNSRKESRRPSRRTRIEEDFRPSRKPSSRKNTDESRLERKITRLERKISKLEEGREETRRPSRRSRVTDSRRKRLSEDRRSEGRTPRRKDCDGKRKPIRKEKRKSSRRSRVSESRRPSRRSRVSESRRPSRRSRVSESRRPLRRNTLDASLKSVGVNDEYKEILALIESKDYNFADKFNAIEAKSFEKNNVDEHKRFIRTLTRSLNKELPKEERISQVRIVEDKDNGLSKEYNEYITESTTELADTDKARVYELIESMTFDDFDNFKEQLDEMIDGYEKLDESKHTDNTTKMNATRAKFWLRDK